MRSSLLFFLIICYVAVSNVAGRELGYLPLLGRLKYLHLFLLVLVPLLLVGRVKRVPFGLAVMLFFVLASVGPVSGFLRGQTLATHYNFALLLLWFVASFQVFDNDKRLQVLMRVVVVTWVMVLMYKEVMFQMHGTSLLFSLSNLRKVGGVRQSSDTVSSLALMVALLCWSRWSARGRVFLPRELLACGLAVYVLARYQVRSVFAAVVLLGVTYFLTRPGGVTRSRLRMVVAGGLVVAVLGAGVMLVQQRGSDWNAAVWNALARGQATLGNTGDEQAMDSELTPFYRAATWVDNVRYSLVDNFAWVRMKNEPAEIEHVYSESFGVVAYENPHNSYLLLLQDYGVLPFLVFVTLVGKTVRRVYWWASTDAWMKFFYVALLSYAFLGIFTPIFELPYQGGVFWVFAGAAVRRAREIGGGARPLQWRAECA